MAITLAGSGNDRVDFGDIAAIAGATAITVAVTLKPSAINAATNNRVIHQWASSTFGAFLIQVVDTDEIGFTVRNGSLLYGPKTTALNLTAGNTYRIVARIGGLGGTKTQSIWVNGSAATTTAWFSGSPASIQNSTSSVQVGHETAETADGVDGDYSEAAIWLESVPDWVAEAYGQGYTALVYQKNQILYAPLENTSRINDIVGGLTGTLTGGATADHPRIIYPAWPEIILSAAGGASPTAVSDTIDVRWNILSLISDSLDTRWNISASVSDAATLQWDLRAPVSDGITAQWHVRSAISDSIDLRWNLRQAIADTLEAQWDILQTGLSAVGDTLDTRWHIRQLANDTVEPRWDIRNTVSDASDLRWHIANAVADTVETQWSVRNLAADDLTLQWDSIGVVGDAVTLQWSITGSGVFVPVNVVVMAERTFTYKIPTRVQ
jgi:hypothetical protein